MTSKSNKMNNENIVDRVCDKNAFSPSRACRLSLWIVHGGKWKIVGRNAVRLSIPDECAVKIFEIASDD